MLASRFRGVSLRVVGLLGWIGLVVAVGVGVPACGPSAVVDRVLTEADASMAPAPERRPARPRPPNNPSGLPVDTTLSPNGIRCLANSECLSRACVDNICCESACSGVCMTCVLPGQEGRCLPVPEDQDPEEECAEQPSSSCGTDGACDGAGACRRYPAGTVCAPGGCEVATESAASVCDGQGVCQAGATKECAPAVCLGDSCGPPCMMDSDCMTGKYCDKGTCRNQQEPGSPCTRAGQCGSGFCTDGVCCNMACEGTCLACNLEGSVGSCTPVPDGRDPESECPVQAIGTCGNAGGCSGRASCRKHAPGTFCAYGSCMNGMQFANSTCDGMGNCRRGQGRSCSPYACNGNLVCWTACANNDQCAPGRRCDVHVCE